MKERFYFIICIIIPITLLLFGCNNEFSVKIPDGAWGFIGAILGSVITAFCHFIFENHRNRIEIRKILIKENYNILNCFDRFGTAISQFYNIAELKVENYTENSLQNELLPTINIFSNDCTQLWNYFRNIFLLYFSKGFKDKEFIEFEKCMLLISSFSGSEKYFDIESFKNMIISLKQNKKDFEKSKVILENIKTKYFKSIKSLVHI